MKIREVTHALFRSHAGHRAIAIALLGEGEIVVFGEIALPALRRVF